MKFDSLLYLNFLWLVPFLIGFYVFSFKMKKRAIEKFARFEIYQKLIPEVSLFKSFLKPFLMIMTFLFLVFALTGPKWGYNWEDVKRRGIDIVLAVDVSRSMLAQDIKPNRLERAKRKIHDLVNMLQGDRIALVAFAGVGFLECPLTLDYSAAVLFIDSLSPDLIPVPGTNISSALEKSIEAFDKTQSTSKAIILITDGETHDENAIGLSKKAKDLGIRIYSIGIGDPGGAPIPLEEGGFRKDRSGSVIMSRLNEDLLQKIALETGGAYVRSVTGDMDLEKIYLNEIKQNLEDVDLRTSKRKIWEERFQIFLLIAFLGLLFEFFLTTKRGVFRQMFKLSFVLFLLLPDPGYALNLSSKAIDASGLYKKNKFDKSLELFSESLISNPDDPDLHYNIGQNYYQLREYQKAIDSYQIAASKSRDRELKEKANFKTGNSLFHMGKLDDAVIAYRNVLDLNPDHEDARKNLAMTLREIKRRMKDQQKTQERCENKKTEDKEKSESGESKDKDKDKDKDEGEQEDQKNSQDENKEGERDEKSDNETEGANNQVQDADKDDNGEDEKNSYKPHEISEEEAKRWLESLDENKVREKYLDRKVPGGRYTSEKDW